MADPADGQGLISAATNFLDKLPIVPMTDLPHDTRDCSICLEPLHATEHPPLKSTCGHFFGAECICIWLSPLNTPPRFKFSLCRIALFRPGMVQRGEDPISLEDAGPQLGPRPPQLAHRDQRMGGPEEMLAQLRDLIEQHIRHREEFKRSLVALVTSLYEESEDYVVWSRQMDRWETLYPELAVQGRNIPRDRPGGARDVRLRANNRAETFYGASQEYLARSTEYEARGIEYHRYYVTRLREPYTRWRLAHDQGRL